MEPLIFEFVDGTQEIVWPDSPRHRELVADGHSPVGSVPASDGVSDALEAFLDERFGVQVETTDAAVSLALTSGTESPAAVDTVTEGLVADTGSALRAGLDTLYVTPGDVETVTRDTLDTDLADSGSDFRSTLGTLYVPQSSDGVYIGTTKYADLHSANLAAIAAGGNTRIEVLGDITLAEPLYVNSTGTDTGVELHGMSVVGARGGAYIDATGLPYAFSFGKRAVDSNSQASGISNGIVVESLDLLGAGIEFWGCQRASTIRNVRVDLTGHAVTVTRGIYALFSSTLQLLQTRVDNGGDDPDGIVLDTCSDASILGGGANYSRRGLTVQSLLTNSQRTTSLNVIGFHTEGNRRQHYDLQAVGNAVITPHVVTGTEWDTAYALVHLGSDAATSAINVRLLGGYINGSGGGGSLGDAVLSDHATDCVVDGTRVANLLNGVRQTASSTGLELRRPSFESSVVNTVVNDASAGETVLPGTQFIPCCSQGGAALGANQTVSLTLGGVNSANATRIPVVRGGSVVGIGLRIGSTLTAGTLTVKVQRNGVDVSGCVLVKGTGGSGTATVRFPPGLYPFTATEDVRVQIATSSDYAVGTAVTPVVNVEYLPG